MRFDIIFSILNLNYLESLVQSKVNYRIYFYYMVFFLLFLRQDCYATFQLSRPWQFCVTRFRQSC